MNQLVEENVSAPPLEEARSHLEMLNLDALRCGAFTKRLQRPQKSRPPLFKEINYIMRPNII